MNFTKYKKFFSKSYVYILAIGLFAIYPLNTTAKPTKQAFDKSIIVFAPTSLTNALGSIVRAFSSQNNISTSTNFESPNDLAEQIQEGDAANIFISDDKKQMVELQQLGLLNVFSLAEIASDRLVIIAPKESFLTKKLGPIAVPEDKMRFLANNVSLVIPDPDTEIAGKSAKQAFNKLSLWNKVEQKMLKAPNNRSALYLVSNGNNAGIVYYSDAVSDPNVEILMPVPQPYYDAISYQASIVADINSSDIADDAVKFIQFLKSDEAKAILKNTGFTILN